jgi:hypothetical protein
MISNLIKINQNYQEDELNPFIFLWISAKGILSNKYFEEIDPMITIFIKDTDTNMYYELGRTNSGIFRFNFSDR